jgi:hypothetical protein
VRAATVESPESTQSGGRTDRAADHRSSPTATIQTDPITASDIDGTSRTSPGTWFDKHASQVKRRCAVYARVFTAANIIQAPCSNRRGPLRREHFTTLFKWYPAVLVAVASLLQPP